MDHRGCRDPEGATAPYARTSADRRSEASMKRGARVIVVGLIAATLGTIASQARPAGDDTTLLGQARAVFQPLPPALRVPGDAAAQARVEAGRMLFFDPRWTLQ